ncbi:Fucose-specific lectin [Fusarium sp. LHS14.1]|nr:Fucose-specific lectin [Fusarium sp. LHS14.1]
MSSHYTKSHLSATTFLHPPSPVTIKQCPCDAKTEPKPASEQNIFIRVYHAEPSIYGYNAGCSLVRESRYSTSQQWHGPSDDLVADDAAPGSSVASVGWWADLASEVWETRVYYVANGGNLEERINHSSFSPTVKDDFDTPLPKPEELIPPTPGWTLTPILATENGTETSDKTGFPNIQPLPETKLAVVRSGDGKLHLFYQAVDNSILEAIFNPEKGWIAEKSVVVASGAKSGTPLTAISGGWAEVRLFFVDTNDVLAYIYADDHTGWVLRQYNHPIYATIFIVAQANIGLFTEELPAYKLPPTAMLAAVAWNYASPFFGIRVYTTDDCDELHEFSYNRNSGGWASDSQSVNKLNPVGLHVGFQGSSALSAVAAVLVEGEWKTKVYFHPRCTILEWDVCAKAPPSVGIHNPSQEGELKRAVEEETRLKIAEEEERKRAEEEAKRRAEEEARKKAEEEEAKRRAEEEEERKKVEAEEARKQAEKEEAQKRVKEELEKYSSIPVGGKVSLRDNPEMDKIFKEATRCNAGYDWLRTNDGWRCSGGGHFLTNEQFETLSRGG